MSFERLVPLKTFENEKNVIIMVQQNNFDKVVEVGNYFKNVVSLKNLMSRRCLHALILTMTLLVCATSCNSDDDLDTGNLREKFLVDKIYNYDDILVAEYFYDNNNRLIKQVIPENLGNRRQEWAAYTAEFEYTDGLVSKIIHKDVTYNMFNYETRIFYDLQGQLIKSEEHMNGSQISHTDYRYENERVVSHTNDPVYTDTIVYDHLRNVSQHIYIVPELNDFGQPIPGTTRKVVHTYNYDNKMKPNFGLDYLFVFQPLPHMGTETGFARELSNNNLTKYGNSGTTWTYTYNKYGLPETIETKWKDIETIDPDTGKPFPMLLKIKYKQI